MPGQWQVFGATVRGASHERTGLPNQDAIRWHSTFGESGYFLILAVSDGHGSSHRSEHGAQIAVKVATEVLQDFQKASHSLGSLSSVKGASEIDLPKWIVHEWREGVSRHLEEFPFGEDELAKLASKAREAIAANPFHAYGATLLSVLLTESYILYLQLGDGDILAVLEDGQVRKPMPADERLFANETTSLCTIGSRVGRRRPGDEPEAAWTDFRVRLIPLGQSPPALILVSTDGYANSFKTPDGFLKVGSDLLEIIRSDGIEYVRKLLKGWLAEASQQGSGDDVTLGVLCRTAAVQREAAPAPIDNPPDQQSSDTAGQ